MTCTVACLSFEIFIFYASVGYGNSLLCGVGWSSDVSAKNEQSESSSSAPILKPPDSTASDVNDGPASTTR